MDHYKDYLFIGLSKLRTTSKAFQDLPISNKSVIAGIAILYLPQMSVVGFIRYETSVDEIYDVRVIKDSVRPGILSTLKPDHRLSISLPDSGYWIARKEDQSLNTNPEELNK